MDIEAYIRSGIIESYVLGLATHEEVAELEAFGYAHPQIQKAVAEFSASLERHAFEHKISPPPMVKQRVLDAIKLDKNAGGKVFSYASNQTEKPLKTFSIGRAAVAACFILLATSAALNFYWYSQYRSKNDAYQALLKEKNSLFADNQLYQTSLQQWRSAGEMMSDSAMATITLNAMPHKPYSMAIVFWDTKTKDVYVMSNKLPKPISGKQYQLWAMVDGKPVNAGILFAKCEGACKMKRISRAQAFAISLEREGGSPQPTMSEVYVMGKI